MEPPRKHHFNPAFSLKPWARADGKICQMRKFGPRVIPLMVHPNATGFERDLYRIDGVGSEQAQHVEVNFFKPLDTEADRAMQIILSGDRTLLNEQMRSAWTRYILSLKFRVPTAVGTLKKHIAEMWTEGINALEADYENRRLPTDPPTFAEYLAQTNSASPEIGAAKFLMNIIDNRRIGPVIFNMHWFRIDLRQSNIELLYSDRPILMPIGLESNKSFLLLPISPNTIFLASRDEDF